LLWGCWRCETLSIFLKQVFIFIVFKVKAFLDCPVTKIIIQNLAFSFRVTFLPLIFWVSHVDAPCLELTFSSKEFFVTYVLIVISINLEESNIVVIINSHVLEEPSILTLCHII